MKRLILISALFASGAYAQSAALNADFKNLIARSGLGAVKDQSYCYTQDGTAQGYRPQKLQRIASVTKLLTTLHASENLDLNRRFTTKIHIGKDSLHIEGDKDPYFEEEKILLLFRALNQIGHTSFKQVSFTRSFLFNDLPLEQYEKITPEKTRLRLVTYLNSKNTKFVRSQWAAIRKFGAEEGIELEVNAPYLSATKVIISDQNPLINENPVVLVHESSPFHSLLKSMNVQSKNYVAENVYEAANAVKTFSTLMKEVGINPATFKIYNGSGLPIITSKSRTDNFASCEMVLKIIGLLSGSIKKHGLVLSDVVAINGGKDLGSFRDRFRAYPELNDSILSKTGTLNQTSSMAGVLMVGHELPFAILNHTTNSSAARKFQDDFVSRMFDHLGPAVPLDYVKISIFPWDGTDFLKPVP